MQKLQGWVEQGNTTLSIGGAAGVIARKVQGSYPGATVTVYLAGTLTLAAIYSDNISTAKANPFVSSATGAWFFYAEDGRYDVKFSGGSIATPFTIGDLQLFDVQRPQNTYNVLAYGSPSDTADVRIGLALADLTARSPLGGIVDARGLTGAQSIASTIVVTNPVQFMFGPATFTGPLAGPTWRTWTTGVSYSDIQFIGAGRGITTFKTRAGAAPSNNAGLSYSNCFETSDPNDLSGNLPAYRIRIAHMTIDGNRANVTAPPLPANASDLSHSGILCQQISDSIFDDLEIKNFWFMGLAMGGLYGRSNQVSNLYTSNNGYSAVAGYGGLWIAGTSLYNTVVNHISNGDVAALTFRDNVRLNTLTGLSYRNNYHGIVMGDQAGDESYGNYIQANIFGDNTVATGGPWGLGQAVSVGDAGLGNTHNNIFDLTVNFNILNTSGDTGVIIGGGVQNNDFKISVSNAYLQGIRIVIASYNRFDIIARNNSRGTPLADYAITMDTGAINNVINASLIDNQGTQTQRALLIAAGCNYNLIKLMLTGASSSISDSGTGNYIERFAITEQQLLNQWHSFVSTGTPPFIVDSTTVVANLHAHELTYNAAGAQIVGVKTQVGTSTIGGGGTYQVTLGSAYSGAGNYIVYGTNQSSTVNGFKIATPTSATQFTITGTAGDVIAWLAIGN